MEYCIILNPAQIATRMTVLINYKKRKFKPFFVVVVFSSLTCLATVVTRLVPFFLPLLFKPYCPTGTSPMMGNLDCFPQESQLRQSHTSQPTVHAGCFSVSIIHGTLTWTPGSLTCTQMLMLAIAYGDI